MRVPKVLILLFFTTEIVSAQTYEKSDSLKAMADLAYEKENWLEASLLYDKAIAAEKKCPSPRNDSLVDVLVAAGYNWLQLDSADQAMVCGSEVKTLAEEFFIPPSLEYARAVSVIGNVYESKADYEKAETMYLQALDNIEHSVGKNHFEYGIALSKLGNLYELKGDFDSALTLLKKAVKNGESTLAPNDPRYGEELAKLSFIYAEIGQYDDALPLLEKSIEIVKINYGIGHTLYAKRISDLGLLYKRMGKYDEALPLLREALELTEKQYGKDHQFYGSSLDNLGKLYRQRGEYEEALPLHLEALENTENSLGKKHPVYAMRLNNLGLLYEEMGNYKMALPLYIEAMEITENTLGKDHFEYGVQLNNLSLLYESLGQYEKALYAAQEAVTNAEKSVGKDHPEYSLRLNNLAVFYYIIGEYEKALPLFQEALITAEKTVGKDHFDYGVRLNNLGLLYFKMGKYDEALPILEKARENTENSVGKEHPQYASRLGNIAAIYRAIGQYDKALAISEESLENYEQSVDSTHASYIAALANLGKINEIMGEYDKALLLFQRGLRLAEAGPGRDNEKYGTIKNNLAGLYQSMGEYEQAEQLFKEALEDIENSLGKDHHDYGRQLHNLGSLFEDLGEYEKALSLYEESIENTAATLGTAHPTYGAYISDLGRLYEKTGDYSKSSDLYSVHLENLNGQIDRSFSFLSEKEKEQFYKTVERYFHSYRSFFSAHCEDLPYSCAAAYDIELTVKSLILNSGIMVRESILNSGDSLALATFDTWEFERSLLAKQYALPIKDRRSDLEAFEERINQLEAELTRLSTEFEARESAGTITWRDVQNGLETNEVAIEFSTFDYYDSGQLTDSTFYYAYIILPEKEYPVSAYLFEESELEGFLANTNERNRDYVQRIYGSAERGATVSESKEDLDLANLIWEPLSKHLDGKSTIYYAPSGLLHRLNLNAIAFDDLSSLADKVQLVQMGSTGDLLKARENGRKPKEAVLFGGLEYTKVISEETEKQPSSTSAFQPETAELNSYSSRSAWGELPYTLREVESIASILEKSDITHSLYSGEAGTEETFLRLTRQNKNPDVLHFATHGYFFERDTTSLNLFMRSPNPLFRSGLIMSNANEAWVNGHFEEGQEDGILTAYEISQLDLRETELVVLSACETGLGDISNSEGVYGLQRAFKLAGVDYIIMTLWQVPDKQSKVMMEKFYTNWLIEGQSIPESFANAQKEMRQAFETYSWAGYVLIQ